MHHLPYNKNLKEFSRELRSNMTFGEVLLWNVLKAGKIYGYTFNRQKPIGNYIVDFYCKPLNLVIEIDGNSHFFPDVAVKDDKKQKALEELGLHFLSFQEKEIRLQSPKVVTDICTMVEQLEIELKLKK